MKPDTSIHAMRMFDGVLSGVGYGALSAVAFALLRSKDIGHRLLLWLGSAYFFVRAGANFYSVYTEATRHSPLGPLIVYAVGGVAGIIFAGIVIASYDDMLTTLRTSEAEDRLRKDREDDIAQAKILIDFLAVTSMEKSAELVQQQRTKAR